ncbi:MAG TPA: thrombospondin type 3 repeat-containing protein [Verrucomicrobiae bacterium]|nr:thrombospondin type 3 repeat-containing protein [Verrucomicrobiae bacterium]
MRTHPYNARIAGLLLIAGCITARASLTTNSWTGGIGKWEDSTKWSAGHAPSFTDAINFISDTPVPLGPVLVTIDFNTANNYPDTMVISNLTVGGGVSAFQTLALSNAALAASLQILSNLTITSHGTVTITNSTLELGPPGGTLSIDGSLQLYSGGSLLSAGGTLSINGSLLLYSGASLISSNTGLSGSNDVVIVGNTGGGQMTVTGGTWLAGPVVVGNAPGSHGTLTFAGGTTTSYSPIDIGETAGSTGTVWLTGGYLNSTGNDLNVGVSGTGQMVVSNGTWLARDMYVGHQAGSQGTLTIAGGTASFQGDDSSFIGGFPGSTGTVWLTGGYLNTRSVSIGGQMVVSNGTWSTIIAQLGNSSESPCALTIAGGTATGGFSVIYANSALWLTGGQLVGSVFMAGGQMTVSNGVWMAAGSILEGTGGDFSPVLTLAGGQMIATNGTLFVGDIGFGDFFITGGSCMVDELDIGIQYDVASHVEISGGTTVVNTLHVGYYDTTNPYILNYTPGNGQLTMAGGSLTVLSNLMVGDCYTDAFGAVTMVGGTLYVTNAEHNAVLDVSNGSFNLYGGTLVVDKLVINDPCLGFFNHSGGTLVYGTLILDPNGDADGDGLPNWWEQAHGLDPLDPTGNNGPNGDPDGDGYSNLEEYLAGSDPQNPLSTPANPNAPPFQITSIVQSNNDVILTWNTAGGLTNQIQVTSGGAGGIYSTNGFTNLGSQLIIPGSGITTTNYLDVGGATNKPARYYRIRLVP